MYNTVCPVISKIKSFYVVNGGSSSVLINPHYYFSDTIDYNITTPNEYTLTNPMQMSTLTDYTELVGKYTFSTTNKHATTVYYITAVKNNTVYYRRLTGGDLTTSLTVGDSYIKNGNTYNLTNSTNINYVDWCSNTSDYSIYRGKYVCDGNNTSCTNLKRINTGRSPTIYSYTYFDTNNTHSYAEDVTYSGGTYTLTGDIKTFWDVFDSTN